MTKKARMREVRQQIRKIARRVRTELESFNGKAQNIRSAPHLGGLCGYGAVMMHEALSNAGLKVQIAQGSGHWFAVCEGFLVDVTASQFGQPKVVVRDYAKLKAAINEGQYLMNWWMVQAFHNTACTAGLCALKQTIDDARKKVDPPCARCGKDQ